MSGSTESTRHLSESQFDAIVVGSGFGGAVTALRLAQAGLRVCLLERGRRYAVTDFPPLPKAHELLPDATRWSWRGTQGLWDVRDLGGVLALQAAGYGGGSLLYANVHLRPPRELFDERWPMDCRDRQGLDRYFDLVGSMLDIQPVPESWRSAGKTAVLSEAFLASARDVGGEVFFPPLAIRLPAGDEAAGTSQPPPPPLTEAELPLNRFGKGQGTCQRCGGCDTGCRYGAKNTLDRNYLALAEQTAHLTVRTLAEVVFLDESEELYTVHYLDHLTGATEQARAQYVFLCAGAVNTTEFVLRMGDSPNGTGSGYFPNADLLATVFGTNAETHPSSGPVITTSLVHQTEPKAEEPPHWFLLQDGGYPAEMTSIVGLLGSPALNLQTLRGGGGSLFGLYESEGPQRSRGDRPSSLLDGLRTALTDMAETPSALLGKLPSAWSSAAQSLASRLERQRDQEVLALAAAVRDAVLAESDLFKILDWAGVRRAHGLRRGLHAWLLELLKVDRERLLSATVRLAHHRFGFSSPADLVERFGTVVATGRYPVRSFPGRSEPRVQGSQPERQRAPTMLLGMGRDARAGRLMLAGAPGALPQLAAELSCEPSQMAAQEHHLRAVARALGGSLRLDPLWTRARKPSSAHSHGGCALGIVTDDYGRLRGSRGIYINDGSLLPVSVGVNPSSTIAAVAERNVEHFVRTTLGISALPWQRDHDWAAAWRLRQAGVALEPPAPAPRELQLSGLGITFSETMTGYLSQVTDGSALPRTSSDDVPQAAFLVSEHASRCVRSGTRLELDAHIVDMAGFLKDVRRTVRIAGRVTLPGSLIGSPEGEVIAAIETGRLHLLIPRASGGYLMTYRLWLSANGQPFTLSGSKELRSKRGPQGLSDTTTLYLELFPGHLETLDSGRPAGDVFPLARGIVRLAALDFFGSQLDTMRVVGSSDPAQTLLVLHQLTHYFLSTLEDVYESELLRQVLPALGLSRGGGQA